MYKRVRLNEVTLVCVAGVEIRKALRALILSAIRVRFKSVKLITPKLPKINIGKFHIEKPIDSNLDSMQAYNNYIIYQLSEHIKTKYCLVIQADGYVIKGKKWQSNFLEYDYIGAPWPLTPNKYIDPFGNAQRVGNGGFSLRSKKLLEVPRKQKIIWDVNHGDFYKHFGQKSSSEDGIICVHNRHRYLSEGCIFAPLDVAIAFSRELPIDEIHDPETFGFHRYKPKFIRKKIKKYLNYLNL